MAPVLHKHVVEWYHRVLKNCLLPMSGLWDCHSKSQRLYDQTDERAGKFMEGRAVVYADCLERQAQTSWHRLVLHPTQGGQVSIVRKAHVVLHVCRAVYSILLKHIHFFCIRLPMSSTKICSLSLSVSFSLGIMSQSFSAQYGKQANIQGNVKILRWSIFQWRRTLGYLWTIEACSDEIHQ